MMSSWTVIVRHDPDLTRWACTMYVREGSGMGRVAAIGLDAAEWWVIERLMADGHLPRLSALRSRSTECRLESDFAYRGELPWTQFLTGVDARDTGYWSTAIFEPSDYSAHMIGSHNGAPFYARDDLSVIAFDVPHTTIHPDVQGIQVTAWGAHSAQYPRASRPTGLLTEIDRNFGVHPVLDNDYDGAWHQPKFIDAVGDALVEGARRRIDVAEWLIGENDDWDLFVTVLSEPHSVGHLCWHGIDPTHPLHDEFTAKQARERLIETYQAVDAGVGRLVDAMGDDASVVVFAAHGMQTNASDVPSLALLPELLHRLHFGESLLLDVGQERWRRSGYRPVRPPERLIWRDVVRKRFARTEEDRRTKQRRLALPDQPVEWARRLQHRLTGKPHMAWDLETEFPTESDQSIDEMAAITKSVQWQPPAFYQRYWPEMDWFVLPTFSDAHVRLNVEGRERDGRIAVDDFGPAIDRFEETVRAAVNPKTGRSAVAEVIRMRDHPLEQNGPDGDLVIVWDGPTEALEHPDAGLIGPLPYQRTGEHSVNGFAFVAGPQIDRADLGVRSSFDLAPTVLELLGRAPDRPLRGTPLVSTTTVG
jgi:predicted AlkP superfamily phosphohydrolase/phosphomutase